MRRSVLLLILASLLMLPGMVQAQGAKSVKLEPTEYGTKLNAIGEVLLEVDQGVVIPQIFTLAVHADLPNREHLSISIETERGVFEIGDLRMLLSRGTMEKWLSLTGEESPVFPIEELVSITVRRGDRPLLVSNF